MIHKIFGVLTVIGIVIYYFFASDYGPKVSYHNSDLYYTNAVTREEVQTVGSYLKSEGIFNGPKKSLKFDRVENRYQLKFILSKQSNLENPKLIAGFKKIGAQVSQNALNGRPVDIILCDTRFNTRKVIPFAQKEVKKPDQKGDQKVIKQKFPQ